MVPLAAMKVTLRVSLLMVDVRMIAVIITIPAVVATPVPAIVPYKFASMLPAMAPSVFTCMTDFAEIVAPIVTSIIIVVLDDHPTEPWFNPVLMFSVDR